MTSVGPSSKWDLKSAFVECYGTTFAIIGMAANFDVMIVTNMVMIRTKHRLRYIKSVTSTQPCGIHLSHMYMHARM